MKCPKCKLSNPENTIVCDCGYSFKPSDKGFFGQNTHKQSNNKKSNNYLFLRLTTSSCYPILNFTYIFTNILIILIFIQFLIKIETFSFLFVFLIAGTIITFCMNKIIFTVIASIFRIHDILKKNFFNN